MSDFVHLHVHSVYSLLDGACRIEGLIDRALELGQKSIAITDHGVMYGAIDFYKAAKKKGIKPIIGCEVYVAPRLMQDKVAKIDASPHHLVLLCETMQGYHNLIKLVSLGHTEGFYSKPRVDLPTLRKHSQGLIALTACLSGNIPRLLVKDDYAGAKAIAKEYLEIFGESNLYMELQNHGIKEQKYILPSLIRLAKELSIPLVATNDAHYLTKKDSKTQSVLMAIQTNRLVDDTAFEFATDEFYIKSRDEMEQVLPNLPEAMDNTMRIAERCCVDFVFGEIKLPQFSTLTGQDNQQLFRTLCERGLHKRYGDTPSPQVQDRLAHELSVIESMGYVDYFLIVSDFIEYARSQGIPVGPGRGSGAGSVAAYCMGITGVDPMKYGLIFERFLNPERVSMPDFDIDFCYVRRQEVIDYVTKRYGTDHVAQIITFGTMAARAAIRDVGRAMGVSYQLVDRVAKQIPADLGITITKAFARSPDFKQIYHSTPEMKNVIDTAIALEGMPRHVSTHAAGVVITKNPVSDYVPVQKSDQAIITQYPMGILEELGLLKMDFLGLRNLTVIDDAQKYIRVHTPDFDIEKILLDDKAVFDMFTEGHTDGIFQFESPGIRQVLMKLRPTHYEDLIAVTSLYRPGPMDSIGRYIQNRHHPEQVAYKHPLLAPILQVTSGCIIYQEQVMEICRKLAGFSYGRADLVRRAMSKKKADVMQKERKSFVHGSVLEDGTVECVGAVANGVSEKIANEIFDEMDAFAAYAFNKSHAAAYALIAYQTAYLKCHYPKEYMAALLTSVLDYTSKLAGYIGECEHLGIPVLPPDVTESNEGFTVTDQGIRFGLLAVKNVGRGFVRNIILQRRTEKFQDFTDFCMKLYSSELNKRAIESLICAGAFDCFQPNRRRLMFGYQQVLTKVDRTQKLALSGQMDFFGAAQSADPSVDLPDVEEYEYLQRLKLEKEVLGLYVSSHPLAGYQELMKSMGCVSIGEILEAADTANGAAFDEKEVKIAAIVHSKKLKITRKSDTMAFVQLEDNTGLIEMIVFPKMLEKWGTILQEDAMVMVYGRVNIREDDGAKIFCDSVSPISAMTSAQQAAAVQGKKRLGLYLRLASEKSVVMQDVRNTLKIFSGNTPVYVYFEDSKTLSIAPKNLWVTVNNPLLDRLKELIGEKNVAQKQ